jgi:hypothetical protein
MDASISNNPYSQFSPAAGYAMFGPMLTLMQQFSGFSTDLSHDALSYMPNAMGPPTNVEELDRRVMELRAVEQWLKLNLNVLQSTIQAFELQRTAVATVDAFSAFVQQSMLLPLLPADTPPGRPADQRR